MASLATAAWLGCPDTSDDDTVFAELVGNIDAGTHFELTDEARTRADFALDLDACTTQLDSDRWVRAQHPFHQVILRVGCMSKHGWEWLGPERAPLGRLELRGPSRRRGFG